MDAIDNRPEPLIHKVYVVDVKDLLGKSTYYIFVNEIPTEIPANKAKQYMATGIECEEINSAKL